MERSRSTLRNKRNNSHRHTYKQRGGAPWAPVFTGPDDERFVAWKAKIEAKGLQDKFPSLLRPNRNQSATTGGAGAAAAAAPPLTDEEKKANLLTYFNCLSHQDELFRIAMEIIREKVIAKLKEQNPDEQESITEINEGTIIKYAEQINAMKDTLFPYIQDVQYFVSFKLEAPRGNNKIMELGKKLQADRTGAREEIATLSTILLFPARVENIFIRAISEFIYTVVVDNPRLILGITPQLKDILATQYDSYTQSLSYTLTSYSLRDGFYLNQGIPSIEENMIIKRLDTINDRKRKFWMKFISVINIEKQEDTLFTSNILLTNTDEGTLAADMLIYAIKNKEHIADLNILTYIIPKLKEIPDDARISEERLTSPDASYDAVMVPDTEVPYKKLFYNIKPEKLEFLLHLEVAIKECFARRKAESAAPTPPGA